MDPFSPPSPDREPDQNPFGSAPSFGSGPAPDGTVNGTNFYPPMQYGMPQTGRYGIAAPGHALAKNGTPVRLASSGARIGGFFLSLVLAIVTLGIGYIIWTLVLWSSGRTPAKQILKQRVVSQTDGTPATWGHMAVREFLVGTLLNGIINSFTFSIYFFVDACFAFSSNHQRLTDKIAQTYVAQE